MNWEIVDNEKKTTLPISFETTFRETRHFYGIAIALPTVGMILRESDPFECFGARVQAHWILEAYQPAKTRPRRALDSRKRKSPRSISQWSGKRGATD